MNATDIYGIPVIEEPALVGEKKARLFNGKLYVSPAMLSLMKGATSEELEHLFKNLEVVNMGSFSTKPVFMPPTFLGE